MEYTKVAVDAMGGDNAPKEIIKGAVDALNRNQQIFVLLVGDEKAISSELDQYDRCPRERIQIVPASEVIETAEHPVKAIQKKKDSSMVVGLKLVKKGEADAFVSSGNSGALLVGGQLVTGRIRGIQRINSILKVYFIFF